MLSHRNLFLKHIAQTSPAPLGLQIVHAEGSRLIDDKGIEYIDLIGGISVCNVGHGNPEVKAAVKQQVDQYMHVMVNGELILSPQTSYARLLVENLPASLNSVFFTSSGSEATEGAMKLAKRFTGRPNIIAFNNSYHGSTQGSLSVIGSEYWRQAYRPLLPGVQHFDYNDYQVLDSIDASCACVIAETVQAEAGVTIPDRDWIRSLRQKCDDENVLLVLDEIQCGFGRNGTLWAFEQFEVIPDILLLGKALGGGMPLGAFIADQQIMKCLSHDPVLGHINTFGGHPVCCAAGQAAMGFLLNNRIIDRVNAKGEMFTGMLRSDYIKSIRCLGLMIAVEFKSAEFNKKIISKLLKAGKNENPAVFSDWFLFAPECMRIAPPLTITEEEIALASAKINEALQSV